jgi:hypothetical protein
LITDDSIDSNLLLENSASKTQLETYPINMIVLATDWSEELYDRMHKITIELADMKPYLLSEVIYILINTLIIRQISHLKFLRLN